MGASGSVIVGIAEDKLSYDNTSNPFTRGRYMESLSTLESEMKSHEHVIEFSKRHYHTSRAVKRAVSGKACNGCNMHRSQVGPTSHIKAKRPGRHHSHSSGLVTHKRQVHKHWWAV